MSKEVMRPRQFRKAEIVSFEADAVYNQAQLQELADMYESFFSVCKPGNVVEGKIVNVNNDGVLVDIGYKSDGLVPRYEFSQHELKNLKVGDNIEVMLDELESAEGNVELSYEKAKALKAWDSIMKLFEEDKPVEGIVTHKVKGGLSVDIGIPAFLPGSQVDVQRVNNFDQYVGQTITANIIKVNQKRGNVIISRRKFLSDQRSEVRQKVLDVLSEGQIIEGIVKNITNYGAFIDIGGLDGLLHITDMTWGRIAHPSEMVKIGDKLKVKILSFDKEHEKISLGIKQLTENPWDGLKADIVPGARIQGKVSSITDYGIFVEVQKGVEGLVHISEISWTDRISDLNKFYQVGQDVTVLVVSIDRDMRRMSLSVKQLEKNPWEAVAQEFKPGQKIQGKISNVTDFGIFVQLRPGIDGLVHVSDLSWTEHVEHPGSIYKREQVVEAIVLGVDIDSKKISLGIKQLEQDPWESIESHYKVGDLVDGEISKITNFGMFVRFAHGIEGLVHVSELQGEKKESQKIEDLYKVGQTYKFKVIKVSREERKLGLTTKLNQDTAREERPARSQQEPREREQREHTRENNREHTRENTREYSRDNNRDREHVAHHQHESAPKGKSQFQLELERHAARATANQTTESNEERTFAIIKPDAMAAGHKDAIIKRIKSEGFTIIKEKEMTMSRHQAEEFYGEHKERPFFGELVNFMTSGPVTVLALAKKNAVKDWRDLMGATNPEEAAANTLRKVFGTSKGNNATHGSDSLESSRRELQLFFPELA